MSFELIYTSVQRGLKPNSSGFCTVAATGGISRLASMKLEGLSAYEFHFGLSDANANMNPANFAHTVVKVGGKRQSVLSRVGFAGPDYSGRANKIAHHFLLGDQERLAIGPGEMLLQLASGKFCEQWQSQPGNLQPCSLAESLNNIQPSGPAGHWQSATGDAGWAGMLAKAFKEGGRVPAYVIYAPGTDVLKLFAESLAVLPPQQRWEVNFATYYTSMPAGCFYNWRGVLAGSRAAQEMAKFPNALVIDLTNPLGHAPDNEYTNAARSGQAALAAAAAAGVSAGLQGVEPDEIEDLDDIYKLAQEDEPATRPAKRRRKVAAPIDMLAAGASPTKATTVRSNRGLKITIAALSLLVVMLVIAFVLTLSFFKGTPPPAIADGGGEGGTNAKGTPEPTTKKAPGPTTKKAPGPTTKKAPEPTTKKAPEPTTKKTLGPTTKKEPNLPRYAKLLVKPSLLVDQSAGKPRRIIECSEKAGAKGYFKFNLSDGVREMWLPARLGKEAKSRKPLLEQKGNLVWLIIEKPAEGGKLGGKIPIAEYCVLDNSIDCLRVRLLSKDKAHRGLAEAIAVEVEVSDPKKKADIYKCRIRKVKKVPVPLHVGFTESGKVLTLMPAPIKYPWPELLALRLPDDRVIDDPAKHYAPLWVGDQIPLKLLQASPPKLRGEIKNNDKDILDNSLTLRVEWDVPGGIKRIATGAISEEREALKKIRSFEDKATDARTRVRGDEEAKAAQKKAINDQLNAKTKPFREECKKQRDKMKVLVNDLKSLQATCKQLPKIIVLDPWGIPLVEFKVKFSVPGDKINVDLVRRLGGG